MTFVYIAIAVVVVIAVWAVSTSNNFKRAKIKIDEARSGIEVALTKRYDMLTKLLDVAKGKIKVESITDIIKSGDRKKAGFTAPPDGLYLERVFYPFEI